MRNGCIVDVLTSVEIQEILKVGGRVIEIYEGVFYRKNFKTSPFRKIEEKLFASRQKFKVEGNESMQELVKLITNNLYGSQIRKNFNEFHKCRSEHWMQTEYDDSVLDYRNLSNGNDIVKLKKDDGLDDNL